MKPNKYIHRVLFGLHAFTFCVLTAGQAMASGTWDGGGANGNWSTANNWSDNVIPTVNTDLFFGGSAQITMNNDLSGLLGTGDLSFTNNGSVGNTTGFVLTGNNASVRNISTTASSSVITDTINLNLSPGNSRIWSPDTNHHLTLNGNISASGFGLTKNGFGILTLSGNNTYTGMIAIQQGTISVNSIADSGFSNLGTSSLRIGNGNAVGTLNYTGSGSTTARTVQIGNSAGTGGATISATGANGGTGLRFTGSTFNTLDTNVTVNNRNLILDGPNTDDNTISGTIQNAKTSGALSVTKNGFGTWILSGNNTYTGATTVSAGTLVFRNTSARSAGTTVTAGAHGTVGIGVGAVSGGYTDANVAALFNTNTLTGFGLNSASGVAIDTTGGNFTQSTALTAARALTKLGANTLTLTGINTYSGATSIPEGTLEVKVLSDVATASSLGAPDLAASVIRLGNAGSTGTLTYTGSGSDTNRQIQIGSGTGTSEAGGGTIRSSGAGILEFTNAAFNSPVNTGTGTGNTLTTRTLTLGGTNTGNNRIAGVIANNLQSETPIVAVVKQDAGTWVLEGANTYTGSTLVSAGKLLVSGSLDASSSVTVASGAILSGAGTVAGPITAAGTIAPGNAVVGVLNAGPTTLTGILAVQIGSAGGDKLLSSGAIDITGATLTVNLLPGGVTQTSYVIVEGTSLTGTFASVPSGYNVIYTTTQAILAKDTYDDWLALNAPANGFDTDTDSDGISNGVEYVLGSNPNTYSSGITLTSSTASSVTYQHPLNPTIANDVSYSYEWSTDLIEWKASGETNSGGTSLTINAGSPVSGIVTVTLTGSASKRFIRLKASLPSMKVYEAGTQKLVCYTNVPGLPPSEFYSISVKSAATGNKWVKLFTHKTHNRQQDLSDKGDPYAEPPIVEGIGWQSVPKISGDKIGHITRTGIRNYLFFTGGWSHSYANIEMTPGTPVEVKITNAGGFKSNDKLFNFNKAAAHPEQKAKQVSVINGEVFFTVENPAQIVIDINGNMDDSNKALKVFTGQEARNDVRHTVSLFANPIMDKPLPTDANVVAVEPGILPSNDLGTKKILFFKPGVHNLGVNFKMRPGKHYYIPGDAIVYGAFNNGSMGGGKDIKMYGYGTISGGRTTHPDYVALANQDHQDQYKSFFVYDADNAEINGICIADPAMHSVGMPATTSRRNDPYVPLSVARWTKVISWRGNGDGIGDVEKTEDCFLRTNDDSGYIKGSKYRCVYWKDTSAAVFHMANIPDADTLFPIVIEDCDLIYNRTLWRAAGSVFNQRGSGAPGLRYIDLKVRNFRIHDKWANRAVFNMSAPSYSGIKFENISMEAIPAIIAADPGIKNTIYGSKTAPYFGGLTFKNVTIGGVLLTKQNFGTYFTTNQYANYFLFGDPRRLTLTTDVNDANLGSVTREPVQATYLEMSPVKLTAVHTGNTIFSYWTDGGAVLKTNPLTVWMTDNKEITAHFTTVNFVDPWVIDIPNSDSWTVPSSVSSITIQAWGGGGAGGSAYSGEAELNTHARGGGGAGGSYAGITLPVQPGDTISYSVGAGGDAATENFTVPSYGASGAVSWVKINGAIVVSAAGGPGGENILIENDVDHGGRGLAPDMGNTGNTRFYGGNGYGASGAGSGSGGGSAGANGNGGDAPSETVGGAAGVGGGAVGGNGHNSTEDGRPGGAPGAGGSGAGVRNTAFNHRTGGKGGDGKVIFSFNTDSYADWLALNSPATGFETDTDDDGIANGLENVFGSNPNTYSSGITQTSSTATSVTYQHPLNPTTFSDVSYIYEWSTDLIEWKASGEKNTGGTTLTISASTPVSGIVTVTLTGSATKRFIRLKAVK